MGEAEMTQHARKHIKFSEGYRDKVYLDSKKYPTFGWGHCLTTERPFGSLREYAGWLFEKDFQNALTEYHTLIKKFRLEHLSCPRRMVLLDMCFNMGLAKVSKFANALTMLQEERYEEAANHFRDSLWYTQVGERAKRLIGVIVSNKYPNVPALGEGVNF